MSDTAFKEISKKVIRNLPKEKRNKQTLGYLGEKSYYVYENQKVGDLTDALTRLGDDKIYCLAVLDHNKRIKGLVVVRDLFSMMGRQFGRAILSKKTLGEIASECPIYDYRQSIFALEEQTNPSLNEEEIEYYLLKDEKNQYKGSFSSRDLLIYFSNITKKDIDMARTIQRRISKEESSVHELKFDLVASSHSAKGVGGDYYSLLKSHEDQWIISVCDVSGKGIAASLLTTTIWGMMSIYDFREGLPAFLYKVNNYIFNTFESEKFITGIFLNFNTANGHLDICDMGHSYIYHYRKGKYRNLKLEGNMPIGVAPSQKLKMSRISLKPGDYIFIPTDGLLEQENHLKELFPEDSIGKIIQENEHRPIEDIHTKIKETFLRFKGGEHLHDDVTYLLLKYYDEPEDDLFS